MPTPGSILRTVRLTHLYLGVFITPAILFFALTGALQTFSLHESTKGSSYEPAKWIVTLAQLHKKQTIVLPQRHPQPAAQPSGGRAPAPPNQRSEQQSQPTTPPFRESKQANTLPMKIFFLLVALGLFTSTLTGLYMSYKFNRNRKAMIAAFVAGIVIPVALLFV